MLHSSVINSIINGRPISSCSLHRLHPPLPSPILPLRPGPPVPFRVGRSIHFLHVSRRHGRPRRLLLARPDSNAPLKLPLVAPSESLPERPGAPDCPYFLKTERCKFGLRCKFNHPKDKLATAGASENGAVYALPKRPSESACAFHLRTGQCKYGATCKFNHPKEIQIPSATQENKSGETETALKTEGSEVAVKPLVSFTSALLYNSKELPVRPGQADCAFYLKTGSYKYGATCRYNHPDRYDINPLVAAISYPLSAPSVAVFNIGVANLAAAPLVWHNQRNV